MNLKSKINLFSIIVSLLFFAACTKEDTSGSLTIKASANLISTKSASNIVEVQLDKFKLNIEKIELEYDDDHLENNNDSDHDDDLYEDLYEEAEFYGPFELDLLNGANEVTIANASVPFDTFEEIEFDLAKGNDTASEMLDKSILAEGTIDGVPFVFWHDIHEEFEVDYPNASQDFSVTGNGESIIINFNLDRVFGITSTIDFSTAIDGNNDGVIEIYPGDPDGNSQLAHSIKELISENTELGDDD